MKRIIFLILSILLIYNYLQKDHLHENKEYKVICTRSDGTIEKIELEEYVLGVVSAEMPASFELEALKAQAVAARTFVFSRDLNVDDTTASQVYIDYEKRKDKWGDSFEQYEFKVKEAVESTKGEVLTYNDELISALYFSSSNGKTENNEDYFNTAPVPYLRSVSSIDETPIIDYKVVSINQDLQIISYTQGGNVKEVKVGNDIYTGREIREIYGLNSSCFEIKKLPQGYAFTTYVYGHGVGMSQYGANGMAQKGFSYDEILKHYYQDVCINKVE